MNNLNYKNSIINSIFWEQLNVIQFLKYYFL